MPPEAGGPSGSIFRPKRIKLSRPPVDYSLK
jgi:hypothetical protein